MRGRRPTSAPSAPWPIGPPSIRVMSTAVVRSGAPKCTGRVNSTDRFRAAAGRLLPDAGAERSAAGGACINPRDAGPGTSRGSPGCTAAGTRG